MNRYDARRKQWAQFGNLAGKRVGSSLMAEDNAVARLHCLRCQRLADVAALDKFDGFESMVGA